MTADKTFLFSVETEGKEGIYEYDFTEKTSRCILEEDIYKKPLNLEYWEKVYGWLTSQTLLMKTESMTEIYEVNVYTGEKVKVAGDKVLGNHLILTDDKSMGCSEGDELLFGGISFSPVLVWDTKEYKVKRFYEGTLSKCGRGNNV